MAAQEQFEAGVCNIDRQGIQRRKTTGWLGLGTTLIFLSYIILNEPGIYVRSLIFLPLFMTTSGLFQGYSKFCMRVGFSNFLHWRQSKKEAGSKEFYKSLRIFLGSFLTAVGATLLIMLL